MKQYKFKRQLVVARRMYHAIYRFFSYFTYAMMNLVVYADRAGHVDFNPVFGDKLHPIDGYLIVRKDGEGYGRTQIPFHCANRWSIRNDRIPQRLYLHDILSQALLAGHNASYIVWGNTALMPYDIKGVEQKFAMITPAYDKTLLRRQHRIVQYQHEVKVTTGEAHGDCILA